MVTKGVYSIMADFSSKETSFIEFISKINTIYQVPTYQRDYSWKKAQWEDLWHDVWSVSEHVYPEKPESSHYLGYIVVQNMDKQDKQQDNLNHRISRCDIIDGQQRLTTLSLLVLAVIDSLMQKERKTSADNLRGKYIGLIDTITGGVEGKLQLNKNNGSYYELRLAALGNWSQVFPEHASNKLLKQAFEFFRKKIAHSEELQSEESLVNFVEVSLKKIVFTEMSVSSEEKAYKLFETLNARGVQLSAIDLLKNYLFNTARNHKVETLEIMWYELSSYLPKDGEFKDFIRYYWNSEYKHTSKADLFKSIKTRIGSNATEAFDFVKNLQNTAMVFKDIHHPSPSNWNNDKEFYERVKEFNFLGATQPYAFLFAMERQYKRTAELKDIFRLVNVLTFRHSTICDYNPNELEAFYKHMLAYGKTKSLQEIQEAFMEIMPSNEQFISALNEKQFDNNTLAKYVLAKMEFYKNKTKIDYLSNDVSLEHIEAKKSARVRKGQVKYVYKIGNLCLLYTKDNQETPNTFKEKKEAYQKSSYDLTNSILNNYSLGTDWSDDDIQQRTQELAQLAIEIWKV